MLKEHLLAALFLVLVHSASAAETESSAGARPEQTRAATTEAEANNEVPSWRNLKRWSFQAGVGLITESTIDEVLTLRGDRAHGDAGGEIYLLQVSYKAAEFKPVLFDHPVDVDLELPLVLGVVDEGGRAPFMQYNGGLVLRWKTFPWNRWLYTNLETGAGLTYSEHVLATEREQHPTRDRSHLEFYWPIHLMLAHPRHREHQLVLFLHHHSGGLIFHRGGANTLGVGYRYVPGER
jgi:hypothetical protein